MSYQVKLTQDALRDLAEILRWIRENDSAAAADHVYDGIRDAVQSLTALPHRGRPAGELAVWGATDYREIRWTSFRIYYIVENNTVLVRFIIHDRRDLLNVLRNKFFED